jgi:uncharacterized NAD(P)/FAD-binding protein YdhS
MRFEAITAISRHGLLPQPHAPASSVSVPILRTGQRPTIREMIRNLRQAVRQTEQAGGDWRSVIDALRPELQSLWKSLDNREKERFLRHSPPSGMFNAIVLPRKPSRSSSVPA